MAEKISMIVEIPAGSRNKYETDLATGRIFLDRLLFTSTHYPADYGYVPETVAEVLALASAMLGQVSQEETPRDVKELLRDLYNVAVAHPTRYRIPTIRSRMPFDRRLLLDGLEPSIGADDLDVLETLEIDKYSAASITRLGLRIDTPESRELVLQTARSTLDTEAAQAIVTVMRETEGGEDVRAGVSTTLAQRFPALDTSI